MGDEEATQVAVLIQGEVGAGQCDLTKARALWERLGEEVALSGFIVPPWVQIVALDQLLPAQLSAALTDRASRQAGRGTAQGVHARR